MMKRSLVFLALFSSGGSHAGKINNLETLRTALGIIEKTPAPQLSKLRVAILDNGFEGFKKGSLPASAVLVPGPKKENPFIKDGHGFFMSQIMWQLTGSVEQGPKFYLVNSHGLTNFVAGINFAIEQKVDLILYSQNWHMGGNFDGEGFINRYVNRAIDAGILWVNNAGNDSDRIYNGTLGVSAQSEEVELPGPLNTLRLKNSIAKNKLSVHLVWDSPVNSTLDITHTDLDLHLYDKNGTLVAESKRVQGERWTKQTPDSSAFAFETIEQEIAEGNYYLRITNRSKNFSPDHRFKVIVRESMNGGVEFTDKTKGEEILIPADNRRVITVGDCTGQSARGPTRDGRQKPDIAISLSKIEVGNKDEFGNSNAAALFASAIIHKAAVRGAFLKRVQLQEEIKRLAFDPRSEKCHGAPVWKLPRQF